MNINSFTRSTNKIIMFQYKQILLIHGVFTLRNCVNKYKIIYIKCIM